MRKTIGKIISLIMTVLLVLGVLPEKGIPVYGAGNYTLHRVAAPKEFAKEYEEGDLSYITNLSDSSLKLTNSNFSSVYVPDRSCTFIYMDNSKIPKKNETKSWKNVAEVTFRDAGYTSDGKFFNLVYTLTELELNGLTDEVYPDNTKLVFADVTDVNGILARAGFFEETGDGGLYEYVPARTPYIKSRWTCQVTDLEGNVIEVSPVLMLFKDIDVTNTVNGTSANESLKLHSGFAGDVYISDESSLQISEGNSLFEAGTLSDNEESASQLLLIMNESSASFEWRGLTCRTFITPTSVTGYPIPDNNKSVDRTSASAGETLHYSISTDFPLVSADNSATSITVTDTLNDILDAQGAVVGVYRENEDVSDRWNVAVEGQTVTWTAKDPASVQGEHNFTIDAGIRSDLVLDDRDELYIGDDGLLYYNIPNSDTIEIADHNGEVITITPPEIPETDIPVGGISLIKDVDKSKIERANIGDTLNYSFIIQNTGLVSLNNVILSDSLEVDDLMIDWSGSSDASSSEGILLPGESVNGTASYVLKQTDIDSGTVHNTAKAEGTDPLGGMHESTDEKDTVLGRNPEIDLVKAAMPLTPEVCAGDRLEYRFEIRNAGNVTLSSVTFEDDHELEDISWESDYTELLPGQKVSGSAVYVIEQADINVGEILNIASVTGTSPDGETVMDTDDALSEIELVPGILLEKTADPAIRTNAHAGDIVPFNFVVTNTGNCTLTGISVEDAMEGIGEVVIDWNTSTDESTEEGSLSGGESVTACAFYTLSQADIDRGSIINTAMAEGYDPEGEPVRSEDDAEVRLPENGEIELVKESEEIAEDSKAGDIIHYYFTVSNTGNVTLTDVMIRDDLPGIGEIIFDWEKSSDTETSAGMLTPGEKVYAYADYTLAQANIDEGKIINYATAVGRTPSGEEVTGPDDDTQELPYMPGLSLIKDVNRSKYENVKAGDMLKYTITAANTGNCTLREVTIEDEKEEFEYAVYDWSGACDEGILEPGDIVRVQFGYMISQDDINKGSVVNTAAVTGYSPDNTEVSAVDDAVTELSQFGKIRVTKTADKLKLENAKPGDEITYTMVAENIGNITLSNVNFSDEKTGLGDLVYNWEEAAGDYTLEPGDKVTAVAVYKITQEDIEKGETENTVIVRGRTPDGEEPEPARDSVTTPIERRDSLKVEKSVDRSVISDARPGDQLNYVVKVTNDGNTELHDISLTDELIGIKDAACDWSGASLGEGILLPGECMTATVTYSILQSDIDRGSVLNTVLVSAKNDRDDPVGPAEDDAETDLGGKPAFKVTKTVDKSTVTNATVGEVLTYTIVGQNTGTVTLTEVSLKDTLRDVTSLTYDWSEATSGDGILLPGESVYATCTYTVKQADISNGKVENTVLMSAKQPNGKAGEKEAKVTTVLKRDPTPTPTPVRVVGTGGSSGGTSGSGQAVSFSSKGGSLTSPKAGPVKTGDDSHALFWLLLGAVALGAVLILSRKKTDV